MKRNSTASGSDWIDRWIADVASGKATMSQRALSSVEAHGGLAATVKAARKEGVHLVRLTDDRGKTLIVASTKPFKTLC
jgi:molybdopterin-guanine dinucleotide biosynthesis protein